MLPFKNLLQLQRHFNTELVCATYLEEQRWNGSPVCPHCGSEHHSRTKTRLKHVELVDYKDFRCKACDKKYSVLTGTFFESSKIELKTWFAAMYLINAHKKGVSSLQLSKDVGVTQKTAWFMLHRIREMFQQTAPEAMQGTVQSDETYVGGKNKNRHADKKIKNSQGRSSHDKTPVVGLYEEKGQVRTFVVQNTSSETLHGIIKENVSADAIVVTDAYRSYNGLSSNFRHIVVKEEGGYKTGNLFHTNNIENFWSVLKRGIIGIYHYTSPKHLHRYCNEFSFRYNSRGITDAERFVDALRLVKGRLKYSQLIGK